MTKEEQATMMIDAYMNLLRLEKSEDRDREIGNQKRELTAKLEALGIVTTNLIIE